MVLESLEGIGILTVFSPYFIIVLIVTILMFLLLRVYKSRIADIGIPIPVTILSMVSSAALIGSGLLPLSVALYWFPILHVTVSIVFSTVYTSIIKYLAMRFVEW